MRGGRYHNLPSKLFCLTVPSDFLEEDLCLRKFQVSKKIMHTRGKEGITVLRRKIFVSAPKVKEKSLCQKNAGIEKCKELERGGASRLLVDSFVSPSTEKLRTGTLVFRKKSGIKKF